MPRMVQPMRNNDFRAGCDRFNRSRSAMMRTLEVRNVNDRFDRGTCFGHLGHFAVQYKEYTNYDWLKGKKG